MTIYVDTISLLLCIKHQYDLSNFQKPIQISINLYMKN